jgi:hypothetical protein
MIVVHHPGALAVLSLLAHQSFLQLMLRVSRSHMHVRAQKKEKNHAQLFLNDNTIL